VSSEVASGGPQSDATRPEVVFWEIKTISFAPQEVGFEIERTSNLRVLAAFGFARPRPAKWGFRGMSISIPN
jgi:hypothetical protein